MRDECTGWGWATTNDGPHQCPQTINQSGEIGTNELQNAQYAEPLDLVERIRRSKSALSVKQLAGMLGCTVSNIQKKAKAGRIPSYRIGGAVKFDPVRTADWLQSKAMA